MDEATVGLACNTTTRQPNESTTGKTGQSTLGHILTDAGNALLGERGVSLVGETNQNTLEGNSYCICKPDAIPFPTIYNPWYTGVVTTKSEPGYRFTQHNFVL